MKHESAPPAAEASPSPEVSGEPPAEKPAEKKEE
jgi:hypothetical protein